MSISSARTRSGIVSGLARALLVLSLSGIGFSASVQGAEKDPDNYVINGDGTVTDLTMGLQWTQCSLGQQWDGNGCTGEALRYSWHGAIAAARTMTLAGHDDWRLPDRRELASLVHCSSGRKHSPDNTGAGDRCQGSFESPTVIQSAFPDTLPDMYWSASPSLYLSDGALGYFFRSGGSFHRDRDSLYAARAVRTLDQ